jgi:hypothetical protein
MPEIVIFLGQAALVLAAFLVVLVLLVCVLTFGHLGRTQDPAAL